MWRCWEDITYYWSWTICPDCSSKILPDSFQMQLVYINQFSITELWNWKMLYSSKIIVFGLDVIFRSTFVCAHIPHSSRKNSSGFWCLYDHLDAEQIDMRLMDMCIMLTRNLRYWWLENGVSPLVINHAIWKGNLFQAQNWKRWIWYSFMSLSQWYCILKWWNSSYLLNFHNIMAWVRYVEMLSLINEMWYDIITEIFFSLFIVYLLGHFLR